ncbi:MAG: CoB--CoM heterodisulfide reductase iron-sulfur subunit A family protein [Actinomycetota bacterium]|nr:CoB--CoM heterodisulfide reductase iron-sulfur subunit A family protein [Actinomycetota bacterium]
MSDSVLVIGGGVCGIQASLDLGDKGYDVYLVEKKPSIGGRMALLDKVFPTNDCSICILAPKMITCFNHSKIEVITYAEVEKLQGRSGNFSVRVRKHSRYIDESKCTGCGSCAEECVLSNRIPNEWDEGLGKRAAVYIPFAQAVPRAALVDPESCLLFTKGKCKSKCLTACAREAIDFKMKDEIINLNVGSIIVATGLDIFDPTPVTEYGYGRFENVIHSMEYERLINAGGPTGGNLTRRSDGERPKRIAYIQCVGARDLKSGHPYCCSVCCMYATKDAMLAYMHNGDTENFIFYTDIRAFGRGFDEYIRRGRDEYKIKYIRARPGEITEDEKTKNLYIWYDDTESGGVKKLEVEMVVLSVAFVPPKGIEKLAKTLGVESDKFGFFKARDDLLAPMDTNVPGVFIAGACTRPMDVTDAVTQGGAAADRAAHEIEENRAKVEVKVGKER